MCKAFDDYREEGKLHYYKTIVHKLSVFGKEKDVKTLFFKN